MRAASRAHVNAPWLAGADLDRIRAYLADGRDGVGVGAGGDSGKRARARDGELRQPSGGRVRTLPSAASPVPQTPAAALDMRRNGLDLESGYAPATRQRPLSSAVAVGALRQSLLDACTDAHARTIVNHRRDPVNWAAAPTVLSVAQVAAALRTSGGADVQSMHLLVGTGDAWTDIDAAVRQCASARRVYMHDTCAQIVYEDSTHVVASRAPRGRRVAPTTLQATGTPTAVSLCALIDALAASPRSAVCVSVSWAARQPSRPLSELADLMAGVSRLRTNDVQLFVRNLRYESLGGSYGDHAAYGTAEAAASTARLSVCEIDAGPGDGGILALRVIARCPHMLLVLIRAERLSPWAITDIHYLLARAPAVMVLILCGAAMLPADVSEIAAALAPATTQGRVRLCQPPYSLLGADADTTGEAEELGVPAYGAAPDVPPVPLVARLAVIEAQMRAMPLAAVAQLQAPTLYVQYCTLLFMLYKQRDGVILGDDFVAFVRTCTGLDTLHAITQDDVAGLVHAWLWTPGRATGSRTLAPGAVQQQLFDLDVLQYVWRCGRADDDSDAVAEAIVALYALVCPGLTDSEHNAAWYAFTVHPWHGIAAANAAFERYGGDARARSLPGLDLTAITALLAQIPDASVAIDCDDGRVVVPVHAALRSDVLAAALNVAAATGAALDSAPLRAAVSAHELRCALGLATPVSMVDAVRVLVAAEWLLAARAMHVGIIRDTLQAQVCAVLHREPLQLAQSDMQYQPLAA